uniref:Mitochondrial pyruvate carrier n=1 Tax=Glossina morsitans morsitans TaxID=37546 RepID=A0A1B0G6T9_GLOMM
MVDEGKPPTKLYTFIINTVDKFVPNFLRPAWNSPAGPKYIFFWAPAFKWLLVIAGINDLKRPAEKVSLNQSTVLALTGVVWSRYAVVVVPKNYTMLSVNLFVLATQGMQVIRRLKYDLEQRQSN